MGVGPLEEIPWTILLNYAEEDESCADVFYDYLRNANLPVWFKRREVRGAEWQRRLDRRCSLKAEEGR